MVAAKHDLIARFTSTPYRPTGLAATDQALANCVELLEWTEALISDAVEEQHDLREAPAADLELIAISSSALRDTASLLAGGDARPDIDELERCRAAVAGADREFVAARGSASSGKPPRSRSTRTRSPSPSSGSPTRR